MSLSRRQFLTLLASGAGGVTLGSLGLRHALPPLQRAARPGMGIPETQELITTCGGCPASCSMRARVVDDKLVGLSGNPRCPVGQGGLCPRGLSEIDALYDPDRLLGPLWRAQPSAEFERSSWDAQLPRLAQRLAQLAQQGRGDRVAVFLSEGEGATSALFRVLLDAIGSPHLYLENTCRDPAAPAAASAALGWPEAWSYDLPHSSHILCFGTPLLEGFMAPSLMHRVYGARRGDVDDRLRLTYLGAREGQTAIQADEFVRLRPGTEALLALGMAASMVREGLVERQLAAGGEEGEGERAKGLRDFAAMLRAHYPLHKVASLTGVEAMTISRLARDFAADPRALALGEQLAGSAGLSGLLAVNSLNALCGRIGSRGGVVNSQRAPVAALVAPVHKDKADDSEAPPFDVVLVQDGAALARAAQSHKARQTLARVPLLVSLSGTMDRAAELAHMVLPQTTRLEQHCDADASVGGFAALAVSRPLFEPLVDARSAADVALRLLHLAAPDRASELACDSVEQVTHKRLAGLFAARRGAPYDSTFARHWLTHMEEAGWWQSAIEDPDAFVEAVYAGGGWVDPLVDTRAPQSLGYNFATTLEKGATDLFAPLQQEASAAADEGALDLLPFALGPLIGNGSANRSSLRQLSAPILGGAFDAWVELHPEQASALGVHEGDALLLRAGDLEAEARVRVYAGVPKGAAAVPWASNTSAGRYGKHWRDLCSALRESQEGALLGAARSGSVKVRLQRLEPGRQQ